MRKLCPNYDKEDGLDTVLEVPIPEEMFTNMGSNAALRWQNLRALMKAQSAENKSASASNNNSHLSSRSNNEFVALLKLVGSPLIPFQVQSDDALTRPINDACDSIEASTAKYIVQQYVAATGGLPALNAKSSMYAVGQVKMVGSAMHEGGGSIRTKGNNEVGGFVLWQKYPEMWYLELVVSGFKVCAGSNGKLAWSQSSSQPCHPNKGPPRPLRRFFQGLDPRSTANLFLEAVCIGEKTINEEDCFVLKLDTATNMLKAQSTDHTEIVRHTIWGYFSQRTGLIVKFEDTKLVRIKSVKGNDNVFWETSIESVIGDYRYVDGINIAHSGKTSAMLYRYGEALHHKRKIEETWRIEEIDFNIRGLSTDYFMPPAECLKQEDSSGIGES
ncbi:hypothetical protein FEM48_Zijuj06G0080300 [Ziziphus jujuba var. spinosa]|uniref:DUF620 domain-containing protein n=1 Tax=Ziziphus jujuba var. spinosa TaxID=714518 RepID=A0A978V843_ZIZJJ|nr:hypothetical protein FEM48_Zijuj06G0080300 [Ziziphus jujuba var. spinosa]